MNLTQILESLFDDHLTDQGPTITGPDEEGTISIVWESNNDGHPSVHFNLIDTGDDEEKAYDIEILVGNQDNVGPKEMVAQTVRCLQQFYEMGLNTRFGRIVGD